MHMRARSILYDSTLGRRSGLRVAFLRVQKVLDGLYWSNHFPNVRWKVRQALQALTDDWQAAPCRFMLTYEARHTVRV